MTSSAPDSGAGGARRLFIGIEMPAFVQARLAALQADLPGARWQWPEDMHLTVRFLGGVAEDRQSSVCASMQGLGLAPFDLAVQGVGSFSGRVFWAAIKPNEYLNLLKQLVDQRLAKIDMPIEERDFVPHVTLARSSRRQHPAADDFLARHRDLELPPWTVKHLTLFSSHPGGSGPMYRVVERFVLDTDAA
ncbi:RNA 2',3'-cyclic phosphodiesterase [Halopseudomonas sp.]|uniref:RNA 2',3'-cyclic phosphodiesterase n=1 Tax=Halopseudomonas sp. TaxID=2901191 RepID=UPI003565EAD8